MTGYQADLEKAQAALASSKAVVEAENRSLAALVTKDDFYRADIKAKQAAIIVAEVNLGVEFLPCRQGSRNKISPRL